MFIEIIAGSLIGCTGVINQIRVYSSTATIEYVTTLQCPLQSESISIVVPSNVVRIIDDNQIELE